MTGIVNVTGARSGVIGTITGEVVSGSSTPTFMAYDTGAFGLAASTYVLLKPGTVVFDTNSTYTTGTGKFVPGVAGKYVLFGQWAHNANPANQAKCVFYKDGAVYPVADIGSNMGTHIDAHGYNTTSTTCIVESSTSSEFQIYGWQDRGAEACTRLFFMGWKLLD